MVDATQITLDLDVSTDQVQGHILVAGGEPRAFSGYAGLIAALELIRTSNGRKPEKASAGTRGPE